MIWRPVVRPQRSHYESADAGDGSPFFLCFSMREFADVGLWRTPIFIIQHIFYNRGGVYGAPKEARSTYPLLHRGTSHGGSTHQTGTVLHARSRTNQYICAGYKIRTDRSELDGQTDPPSTVWLRYALLADMRCAKLGYAIHLRYLFSRYLCE